MNEGHLNIEEHLTIITTQLLYIITMLYTLLYHMLDFEIYVNPYGIPFSIISE